MKCLDTSFLIDYLDGNEAVGTYLEDRPNTPFFAPSLSLYDAYRGAARTGGPEAVERVKDSLDWVEPIELDAAGAREASLVEAELLDDGSPINLGDALIAGVVRNAGGTIVTNDSDFEAIPDLAVEQYR